MRISIITPSFNQAQSLEQTILSVLNQSYPDIEYIVIDGESTDGSVDILRKYAHKFAYWHSRKDRGHWDAVHQGFQKATGDILYFLNSDDLLLENNVVSRIVQVFQTVPNAGVVYGKAKFIDAEGRDLHDYPSAEFDLEKIYSTWENPVPQPSAFIRRAVFTQYGSPDEAWPFCADFIYWLRISEQFKLVYVPEYFSCMRIHSGTKTARMEGVQAKELINLCEQTIKTERFRQTGLDPKDALQGVHFRAAMLFRRSGKTMDAIRSYFVYCQNAFSLPVGIYRFARYLAGIVFK